MHNIMYPWNKFYRFGGCISILIKKYEKLGGRFGATQSISFRSASILPIIHPTELFVHPTELFSRGNLVDCYLLQVYLALNEDSISVGGYAGGAWRQLYGAN